MVWSIITMGFGANRLLMTMSKLLHLFLFRFLFRLSIFANDNFNFQLFRTSNPSMQESSNMPTISRSSRKPSISILLTIEDDGETGEIRVLNSDDDHSDGGGSDSEIKRKIGKRLIKKLVRSGDVDRKPNYRRSEPNGCQFQLNNKYDELMASLNTIVDRALHGNRVGYENSDNEPKSPTVRRSTTPMPDNLTDEDKLYDYIISVQKQLSRLVEDAASTTPNSQPVKRYRRRCNREVDYDSLAREILRGIGIQTDDWDGNYKDQDNDGNYRLIHKFPITTLSDDPYAHGYDTIDVIDDVAEFMPTKNVTKRHSLWLRSNPNKLMEILRKPDLDAYCVNYHKRMRRSADSETTDAPKTHLLHIENNYGIDSKEGDTVEDNTEAVSETTKPPTTESSAATTESSDKQSTLELSVTSSATEPSMTTAASMTVANTGTVKITKNGIQVPLRLITDSTGKIQFILNLDRKTICGKCKCKCKRRNPRVNEVTSKQGKIAKKNS